jgi:hypothetical protein
MIPKLQKGDTISVDWYNDVADALNKQEQEDLMDDIKLSIEPLEQNCKNITIIKKVNEIIDVLKQNKIIV